MKKTQVALVAFFALVFLTSASTAVYFYVAGGQNQPAAVKVEKTTAQKELETVKADLDNDADFDFTEVDEAVKDLESIDLTGV